MVQLRSCYFCGTAEAVTEYETLPNAVRTEARTQRVALCDRCQKKLTTVMTPIVEALDPDDAPPDDARETTRSVGDSDSVTAWATDAADDPAEQPEVTFSDEVGGAGDEREEGSDGETLMPTERSADDSDATAATDTPETDHTASETEDATETDDSTMVESDDGVAVEAADTTDDGVRDGDELDVVYHKLLRFLRNREFPIPRAEAETVAQSAYDLSTSDAAAVIQRAIDRGVLDERGGDLHRL